MASFPRLKQWVIHHTSAFISTGTDYLTMISLVQLVGLSPVISTAASAAVGATTGFILGRHWTYHAREGSTRGQAWRYVLVAATSLALNTLGEHLFVNLAHVQYILGRVITGVVVSNGWNYPMQRFFVFRGRKVPT